VTTEESCFLQEDSLDETVALGGLVIWDAVWCRMRIQLGLGIDIMDKKLSFEKLVLLLVVAFCTVFSMAQEIERPNLGIMGSWLINDELSDSTDDQVEKAIKEGGGKVPRRWFSKRPEDFYRGGPKEHELYDRMSYDDVLTIDYEEPEFKFTYEESYQRIFHTDGRRRKTTANDFYAQGNADFSFANWDDGALIVEARPRDGGFTLETYTLEAEGSRLRVEMVIEPASFSAAINLVRIYDRVN